MLTIIIILLAGAATGRLWLYFTRREATLAGAALGYVVWAMLAAFGLRIGADPDIMDRLPSLGLQALILGAAATFASGICVMFAFRGIRETRQAAAGGQVSFSASALRGSAVTMLFFAAGLFAGRLGLLPVDAATAETWANLLLKLLILLVGISTGSNPRLLTILRSTRPIVVAMPVLAVFISLATGAAAGALTPLGAPDGAMTVSGMGYYSLSSMIISDLRTADIGAPAAMSLAAVALMANLVREICALLFIPVIGPRLGLYGSTAMCGVTSIDVTLPVLVSTFGAEAVPVALINGLILEVSTPFTVMAVCSAVTAIG